MMYIERIKGMWQDSLYRNSLYLIASTAVMAVLGFIYWLFAARLYSAQIVGLVATLVAISNVVMTLSILGFDNSFIRYLPKSKYRNEQMDTGFTVAAIMTLCISVIYLAVIHFFIPNLSFITVSLLWIPYFIFFMIVNCLNYLTNFTFIAFRTTLVVLAINIFYGMIRLLGLVGFTRFGLKGLLSAHVVATFLALLLTVYLMRKRLLYRYKCRIVLSQLKVMGRYTLKSYFSIIFLTLPTYFLPVIIVGTLGADSAAYYYIVAVIVAGLNIIPMATSQSLFAEGVWDRHLLQDHVRKAIKIILFLLLPAICILILFGSQILNFFGEAYEKNGYALLVLLTLASLPKMLSYILSTILRIDHQVGLVVAWYAIYAVIVIGGSYFSLKGGGTLESLGWITLGTEVLTALGLGVSFMFCRHSRPATVITDHQ